MNKPLALLALLALTTPVLASEPARPTVTLTQDELLALIDAQVAAYASNTAAARAKPTIEKVNAAFAPAPAPEPAK